MERTNFISTNDREDVMYLLKVMVLLCILCVILTLYFEYMRMSRFEKMVQKIKRRLSPVTTSWALRSSDGLSEQSDTFCRTPTP